MLGFKSFRSAKITIAGIENIRMIQKGQIVGSNNKVLSHLLISSVIYSIRSAKLEICHSIYRQNS